MLPYGLAIAVGLSSFILFLTAFLMPKIHRQDDFFWSGLGFFYALVLWFCATQITGAVLLGQLAAVALLVSCSWQVIKLRKAVVNPNPQQVSEGFSVTGFIGGIFNRSPKAKSPKVETVARVAEEAEDLTPSEEVEKVSETSETAVETKEESVVGEEVETATESKEESVVGEEAETAIESEPESPIPASESKRNEEKPGLFNRLTTFGKQESKSASEKDTPSLTNTKLDELLDDDGEEQEQEETKPEAIPEAPVEEFVEETNWDFLDEEPEITKKDDEPAPESVNESAEEIKEQTTSPDLETSQPEEETN